MNDNEYKRLTPDQINELLPAFVVGALDRDEMLAVEQYLQVHPELMRRVHELEMAAARLAYAAPPRPLPQHLHGKIMNRARGQLMPRVQLPSVSTPAPASKSAPVTMQPTPRVQPRIERVPSRPVLRESGLAVWWRKRGLLDLAAIAAIAAAVVLAAFYRGALVDLDDLRGQVQTLEQQMAAITGAQHVVTLSGTEAAPQASARLYVRDTVGTLVVAKLDPLGADQIYQLWLIPPEGAPIPAGLFNRVGEQSETITLKLPAALDSIAQIGVSVEPLGGSAAPTGPIVLLGERA